MRYHYTTITTIIIITKANRTLNDFYVLRLEQKSMILHYTGIGCFEMKT